MGNIVTQTQNDATQQLISYLKNRVSAFYQEIQSQNENQKLMQGSKIIKFHDQILRDVSLAVDGSKFLEFFSNFTDSNEAQILANIVDRNLKALLENSMLDELQRKDSIISIGKLGGLIKIDYLIIIQNSLFNTFIFKNMVQYAAVISSVQAQNLTKNDIKSIVDLNYGLHLQTDEKQKIYQYFLNPSNSHLASQINNKNINLFHKKQEQNVLREEPKILEQLLDSVEILTKDQFQYVDISIKIPNFEETINYYIDPHNYKPVVQIKKQILQKLEETSNQGQQNGNGNGIGNEQQLQYQLYIKSNEIYHLVANQNQMLAAKQLNCQVLFLQKLQKGNQNRLDNDQQFKELKDKTKNQIKDRMNKVDPLFTVSLYNIIFYWEKDDQWINIDSQAEHFMHLFLRQNSKQIGQLRFLLIPKITTQQRETYINSLLNSKQKVLQVPIKNDEIYLIFQEDLKKIFKSQKKKQIIQDKINQILSALTFTLFQAFEVTNTQNLNNIEQISISQWIFQNIQSQQLKLQQNNRPKIKHNFLVDAKGKKYRILNQNQHIKSSQGSKQGPYSKKSVVFQFKHYQQPVRLKAFNSSFSCLNCCKALFYSTILNKVQFQPFNLQDPNYDLEKLKQQCIKIKDKFKIQKGQLKFDNQLKTLKQKNRDKFFVFSITSSNLYYPINYIWRIYRGKKFIRLINYQQLRYTYSVIYHNERNYFSLPHFHDSDDSQQIQNQSMYEDTLYYSGQAIDEKKFMGEKIKIKKDEYFTCKGILCFSTEKLVAESFLIDKKGEKIVFAAKGMALRSIKKYSVHEKQQQCLAYDGMHMKISEIESDQKTTITDKIKASMKYKLVNCQIIPVPKQFISQNIIIRLNTNLKINQHFISDKVQTIYYHKFQHFQYVMHQNIKNRKKPNFILQLKLKQIETNLLKQVLQFLTDNNFTTHQLIIFAQDQKTAQSYQKYIKNNKIKYKNLTIYDQQSKKTLKYLAKEGETKQEFYIVDQQQWKLK